MIIASFAELQVEECVISLEEFKKSHPNLISQTLPALQLEDGEVITSSLAITKYLAAKKDNLLGSAAFEQA